MSDTPRPAARRPERRAERGRERARERDPLGKQALFSSPPAGGDDGPRSEPARSASARSAPPAAHAPPAPTPPPAPALGSNVVVECSACGASARMPYADFALAQLPFALWVPPVGVRFNRRMSCPACGRWAWMRARWLP